MRPALRCLLVTAVAVCTVSACGGDDRSDAPPESVALERTTTTSAAPCDVPRTAERALSEATFGATRADAAARAEIDRRLDELRRSLPADLGDDVEVLADAFERAAATPPPDADPFDTPAYLAADQAIRRYVDADCPPA